MYYAHTVIARLYFSPLQMIPNHIKLLCLHPSQLHDQSQQNLSAITEYWFPNNVWVRVNLFIVMATVMACGNAIAIEPPTPACPKPFNFPLWHYKRKELVAMQSAFTSLSLRLLVCGRSIISFLTESCLIKVFV